MYAKSSKQKLLEGHPNKAIIKQQAEIKNIPTKPKKLSGRASRFWGKYVPLLIEKGLATDLDSPKLEQMAVYWDLWQSCIEQIDRQQLGTPTATRLLNSANKAFDNFRRIAQMFGMSPLPRNALTITDAKLEADEFFKC